MPDHTTSSAATGEDATSTSTDTTIGTSPDPRPERRVRSFTDVGVDPALADALAAKGIHHPFPIQELTLPIATKGHDVIGQARTGTGKTLAFGLALLGRVTPGAGTQALVIVPTRELCLQVADELQIGETRGLRVIAVYGGVGYEEQEAAFRGGHEVVVGTPGRLLDHLNKGNLRLDGVTELVLDEADEMLDMGFLPDVERLIQACNDDRHGMLFSATMPSEVVKLARRYLDHPTFMRADTEPLETAPSVEQHFFQVHRMDKPRVLARILQTPERGGVYVFVRTKQMADRLVRELEDLGTAAIAIHGDLRQATREKNLDRFRDGSATVLVATEVAARGLDVEGVTHVVNYDCPDDEKMYLHRIGRTARAGNAGVAVTFAEFNEVDRLNVIRKKVGADTPIEAVFSTSEELTERFGLPSGRPWDAHVEAARAGTRTDRRSDDGGARGDRDRGGRGRDGRRQGRTDGRPKSKRSSEGTGHDRDADRDRRARARARDGASEGRDGGDGSAGGRADVRDDASEGRSDERRRGAGEGRGTGERDAETRTRTRTRTRQRTAADAAGRGATSGREDDRRDDTATSSAGGGRQRARRDRGDAQGRERSAASGDDDRRRDGDADRSSRQRTSRASRDDRERSGSDAGSDRQRGARGSRGRDQRGGGKRDGDQRGSRDQRAARDQRGSRGQRGSGGRSGRDQDPTVVPARRGEEARGTGDPQLARRVRVEHLP